MTVRFAVYAPSSFRASCAARLLAALLAAVGCTPTQVATRPMLSMDPLSHDLKRGVSTRADVHRLLGEPSGDGGFVLPPNHSPQDVWFYQEMRFKDFEAAQDLRENYLRANMTQKILLVFFRGDVFDGYLWYSNEGFAEGKSR